jgi:hypothetical protein
MKREKHCLSYSSFHPLITIAGSEEPFRPMDDNIGIHWPGLFEVVLT